MERIKHNNSDNVFRLENKIVAGKMQSYKTFKNTFIHIVQ